MKVLREACEVGLSYSNFTAFKLKRECQIHANKVTGI